MSAGFPLLFNGHAYGGDTKIESGMQPVLRGGVSTQLVVLQQRFNALLMDALGAGSTAAADGSIQTLRASSGLLSAKFPRPQTTLSSLDQVRILALSSKTASTISKANYAAYAKSRAFHPLAPKVVRETFGVASNGPVPNLSKTEILPSIRPAQQPATAKEPASATSENPAVKPAASLKARFLEPLLEAARSTAESLGVSPHLLLAHAALESGWGRRSIKDAGGGESHNLFGIKTGQNWKGRTVDIQTTEYVHGVPQKKVDTFRAYDSFGEAFADYARLLKGRYARALDQTSGAGFGQALQEGGFATDPGYAGKIARVSKSVSEQLGVFRVS